MRFYRYAISVLSIFIFCNATCQIKGKMSEENQRMVNQSLMAKRFYLKYSFYYGDFYGNTETCLLSTRRFDETVYLEDVGGRPILPGKEKGVVPFNREVMVERVEFPPANRPLLTPRFYPWVYVKVDGLEGYRNCIVVIRPDVESPEDFFRLFYDIFSADSLEGYIKGLNSEVRDAIFSKRYIDNAREEEILIIFGRPDSIRFIKENGNSIKILDYTTFRVYLKDNRSYRYEKVEGIR